MKRSHLSHPTHQILNRESQKMFKKRTLEDYLSRGSFFLAIFPGVGFGEISLGYIGRMITGLNRSQIELRLTQTLWGGLLCWDSFWVVATTHFFSSTKHVNQGCWHFFTRIVLQRCKNSFKLELSIKKRDELVAKKKQALENFLRAEEISHSTASCNSVSLTKVFLEELQHKQSVARQQQQGQQAACHSCRRDRAPASSRHACRERQNFV